MKILSSDLTPVSKFMLPGAFLVSLPLWLLGSTTQGFDWVPAIAWTVICVSLLWWALPIKKVSLVGDRLRISNYWQEIDVPVSDIKKIRGSQWNRTPNVTLFFDPPTAFGTKIRIVAPLDMAGEEVDRVIALLECAIASSSGNA